MTYHVRQEKFEGPLEVLLDLVERERLSVSEVSLSRVAEEYLAYVQSLASPDPEELAGFLLIAVQLILIKSRSLLPGLAVPPEEEQSIQELEERLRLLQRLRDAGRCIKDMEQAHRRLYGRIAYQGMAPVFAPPRGATPDMLAATVAAVLALIPKAERIIEEKMRRVVSLEERIQAIRRVLHAVTERGFSEVVRGAKEKMEIVVSFLALLELARQKFVDLSQETPFADIRIRKVISNSYE